ncbi:Transcriptional regulatory protein [Salinisphaera shabanensis E1L3A]|uniref:Transcriptional regulatory protein n=1 Tax=Salinisphaera shabanensis E1L3A TaxID=1033802 RepID=U2E4F4_9GAMM|nr:LysR family transcriptional regulator [Salinisphaera shabanensis]ERJ18731.1 Transcriptional regulatory protein [Salinisphaera shabanensis E1L3A]
MDRLTSLRVFLRTIDLGSFSAAARDLGMSPQMAGKHVDALEAGFGTALLHRSTRRLSLTEAGRICAEGARRTLDAVNAMDASVENLTDLPHGRLRVTAPASLGRCRIVPNLPTFEAAYPDITLELTLADRVVDLTGEGFDIALRVGDLRDSELAVRGLAPFRIAAFASPGYVQQHGLPNHPSELEQHRCLNYVFDSYPAPDLWVFKQGEEQIKISPRQAIAINDATSLIELALRDAGVVMTGEMNVADHVAAGTLLRLFPDYTSVSRPLNVLFHRRRAVAPRERVFIDWVVNLLGASKPE